VCEADGACRCMCPDDPDCRPEQCAGIQKPDPETILAPQVPRHEEGASCPETMAPIELYMSNDDSNSQASPILARRTIREGRIVSPELVRIHEFMNYYDFSLGDGADAPARVAIEMRRTDPDAGQFALMLYASGRAMSDVDRPPMNLVFSLDTSGSMAGEPIELLQETMRAMAASLRAGDVASIVTWSDTLAVVLDGHVVNGPSDPALLAEIDAIASGGGTNLNAGLVHAYDLAGAHFIAGGINRVVLISDGGANLGITDADLIGSAAADADGEGVYLVGVGVGESSGYNDALMNAATDAGKGAYVFIDSPAEAHRQFEDHFLSNVAVAARDVRMKVTLPWYFGIQAFHGEEYSSDPTEVEPQHLSPNDVMAFHQIISACDPSQITECDAITASVDYQHPLTGEAAHDEISLPLGELVQGDATRLRKADAIVGYAKSLIVIGILGSHGEHAQAAAVAGQMRQWLSDAATASGDAELADVAALMGEYETVLAGF
jgi:Mg-chelatase subunit ChlD